MKKYLILLIAVTLVAVMFTGCTSSAPAPNAPTPTTVPVPTPTPSLNNYNAGDVVTTDPTFTAGFLILKYDPVGDVYITRGVMVGMPPSKAWQWLDKQPEQRSRQSIDTAARYKLGYIADPAIVKG